MPSIASLKALSSQKAATLEPWLGLGTGLELGVGIDVVRVR